MSGMHPFSAQNNYGGPRCSERTSQTLTARDVYFPPRVLRFCVCSIVSITPVLRNVRFVDILRLVGGLACAWEGISYAVHWIGEAGENQVLSVRGTHLPPLGSLLFGRLVSEQPSLLLSRKYWSQFDDQTKSTAWRDPDLYGVRS